MMNLLALLAAVKILIVSKDAFMRDGVVADHLP